MCVKILHSEVLRCRTDVGRRREGGAGNGAGPPEDWEQKTRFGASTKCGSQPASQYYALLSRCVHAHVRWCVRRKASRTFQEQLPLCHLFCKGSDADENGAG